MIVVEEDRFTYDGSSDVLISDFKVVCKNLLRLLPSISKLDFYETVEFLFIDLREEILEEMDFEVVVDDDSVFDSSFSLL